MKLETLGMQSDNRFAGKAGKDNTMVIEDHRHAGRKNKVEKLVGMDRELVDIRAEMEWISLKMQLNVRIDELELKLWQDKKPRWVYEWPMRKAKAKWPVKELMLKGQRRLLKRWLRYAENLKAIEEKMTYVCEPETGRGLDEFESEMGSVEYLKDFQEGREKITVFQVGNEMRLLQGLTECQEDS
jgi:hypothetical protein